MRFAVPSESSHDRVRRSIQLHLFVAAGACLLVDWVMCLLVVCGLTVERDIYCEVSVRPKRDAWYVCANRRRRDNERPSINE